MDEIDDEIYMARKHVRDLKKLKRMQKKAFKCLEEPYRVPPYNLFVDLIHCFIDLVRYAKDRR